VSKGSNSETFSSKHPTVPCINTDSKTSADLSWKAINYTAAKIIAIYTFLQTP